LLDRLRQKASCPLQISSLIGSDSLVKALFGLALTFGQCAAGTLDICAGAPVATLEKRHTRPHVNRLLVVATEVMVEAGQQQLFDTRGAIGLA
jgi:hypothetical protein